MVQLELGKNLLKYINTYDIDSSEYVIAKKALTLSKDLEKLSINDFTDLCFVSPPTISRFCKKEGCNNFIEFKTLGNQKRSTFIAISHCQKLISSRIRQA